jgi:hypothetical protein
MFFSIIPEGVPCSTQTSDLSQIIGVICAVNNDAFRALQKRHTAQEVGQVCGDHPSKDLTDAHR